jgi:hypothetical protein
MAAASGSGANREGEDYSIGDVAGAVPPSQDLLEFYQKRIASFEEERTEFLKRFGEVEVRLTRALLAGSEARAHSRS